MESQQLYNMSALVNSFVQYATLQVVRSHLDQEMDGGEQLFREWLDNWRLEVEKMFSSMLEQHDTLSQQPDILSKILATQMPHTSEVHQQLDDTLSITENAIFAMFGRRSPDVEGDETETPFD